MHQTLETAPFVKKRKKQTNSDPPYILKTYTTLFVDGKNYPFLTPPPLPNHIVGIINQQSSTVKWKLQL